MIASTHKQVGFIYLIALAIIALVMGIALHYHYQSTLQVNQQLDKQYQERLAEYHKNNIYYEPQKTIDWLAIRQNAKGYFVTNPDLINEPSQLNANSLRATRYAVSTLQELQGLSAINTQATSEFVLERYQEYQDSNGQLVAGFATQLDQPLGIRPTMDALLTLNALNSLDNPNINLDAVKRFILQHQNADGGFWDPHYPKYQQRSCLKCSSFAMRALGIIQAHTQQQFDSTFQYQFITYIDSLWDKNNQSYAEEQGSVADDSYDIFRAFISLWHLKNATATEQNSFALNHLNIVDIQNTIKQKFVTDAGAYSRKIDSNQASMKATHLLVWMYWRLGLLEQIDQQAIIQYVLSNQSAPGEYGGDIYNTYSATGILNKLQVSTVPLKKPKAPQLADLTYPDFLPYLLYLLASLLLMFYYLNHKKQLENKTIVLESKVNKDKLTGLFNREYLENAYQYHSASGEKLSLILIDVDFFKNINDNFGHLTGDYVLQELAKLIGHNIRKTDVLARWGGEEFAILCPATVSGPAKILAEKLRTLIHDKTFDTIGNITCSFGVSTSHEDDSLESLFWRADKALYQSKKNGRNQVTFMS
ncbi:MAG: diguanylate cyclase [Kangiellaceae bacterium]|nr:diguanylate cyclase [Kangiellaceae bacterium]